MPDFVHLCHGSAAFTGLPGSRERFHFAPLRYTTERFESQTVRRVALVH